MRPGEVGRGFPAARSGVAPHFRLRFFFPCLSETDRLPKHPSAKGNTLTDLPRLVVKTKAASVVFALLLVFCAPASGEQVDTGGWTFHRVSEWGFSFSSAARLGWKSI